MGTDFSIKSHQTDTITLFHDDMSQTGSKLECVL